MAARSQNPPSLVRNLWDEWNEAMSRGLSNLGTYNPASRLPSGGPSDHSHSPSDAFDVGGPPDKLAQFFKDMIGRPGIHYVIYQDLIWSREKGLHPYRSGGHETHVHVSGVVGANAPPSAVTQRRDTSLPAAAARKAGEAAGAAWDYNPLNPTGKFPRAIGEGVGKLPIPGAGAITGALDAARAPGEAIKWAAGNWDRVLEVVGGFVLLLVGLILMGARLGMAPSSAGKSLAGKGGDPVEAAYSAGEAQGLAAAARSEGRRAGRQSYRASRPSSQGAVDAGTGDDIPF